MGQTDGGTMRNKVMSAIGIKKGLMSDPSSEEDLAYDPAVDESDDSEEEDMSPGTSIAGKNSKPDISSIPGAELGLVSHLDPSQDTSQKLLSDYNVGEDRLRASQKATNEANLTTNLGRAFSNLARGGLDPKDNSDLYSGIQKQNEAAPTQVAAALGRRASVVKAIGQMQGRQAAAKTAAEAKVEAAQTAADAKAAAGSEKAGDKQTKNFDETVKFLEQMRGSPAVSQAEKDLYASKKAQSLIDRAAPDGNLDKLSHGQAKLMLTEVAKMASGGVPSMQELKDLDPGTLRGSIATAWGQLINEPTEAKLGSFLKQYKDYADALSKDAQDTIKDRYSRIIGTRRDNFSDDQNAKLDALYMNRFDDKNKKDSRAPQFVKMKAPDGSVRNVPIAQKDAALAKGGVLVQ